MRIWRSVAVLWLGTGLVSFSLGQAPQPQAASREEPAIAEGQVISSVSGEPIPHARVVIRLKTDASNPQNAPGGFAMETDDAGTYHFEKLDPGKYDINVTKTGYLRTSYGAKRPNGPGVPVLLQAGQTTSKLDIKMYPEATISGVITDDHGEPLVGNVQLVKKQWMRGKLTFFPRSSAASSSAGRYLLTGVLPGRYLLQVNMGFARFGERTIDVDRQGNPVNSHLVTTFYGDTTSPDSATLIQIQPGQEISDANIRVQREPTFHVKGRIVSVPPGDSPLGYMPYLVVSQGWMMSGSTAGPPKKDGGFEIDNVQPGSYELHLAKTGNFGSGPTVPIEISNGNIDNLEVSVPPPMEIQGRIVTENGAAVDLSGAQVRLTNGPMFANEGVAGADGSFVLHNVNQAQYQLSVSIPGQEQFVKSIRLGARDMPGDSVDLTQGATGPLEIVLSFAPAKLDGSVTRDDNDSQTTVPAAAINVVLIPEKRTDDYYSGIKYASTDGQGHFTFKDIAPGRYKAFAADGIDYEQWTDPQVAAALDSHAVQLEFNEGDNKQLQLKLITAAESSQVLERLGL